LDGVVQVGVISSGSGCNGLLPTNYARVSSSYDWIQDQICDLSGHPPSGCGGSDPGNGKVRVRVDIVLDAYPEDIVWMIKEGSKTGDTVASGGGDYKTEYALESIFVNLADDTKYVFIIEDEFGDGLGSDGTYKVVEVNGSGNDMKTLVSGGGDFGSEESKNFSLGDPPSSGGEIKEETTDAPTREKFTTDEPTETPTTPEPTETPKTPDPTDTRETEPAETDRPENDPPESELDTEDPVDEEIEAPIDEDSEDRRRLVEVATTQPAESPAPATTDEATLQPTIVPTVIATLQPTETSAVQTSQPSRLATEEPTIAPSSTGTSPSPTISPTTSLPSTTIESPEPSIQPTISQFPTDSLPSDEPSNLPSVSVYPSTLPTVSVYPSQVPSSSISETDAPSPGPTSTLNPTAVASQTPTMSSAPSSTSSNITTAPTTTDEPSANPTSPATVLPTSFPSSSPTITITNYIGAVNLEIFSNPEGISWRILDDDTGDSIFGYPSGWYEENGTFVKFINLQTGTWEFQLERDDSLAGDARAEIGIVDTSTGAFEVINMLDFSSSTEETLSTIFVLE
jgi:hypothetical protein